MMYSEFIELTQVSESYISYNEYTTMIEPIYMDCKLPNKREFCKMWNEFYDKMVVPAIELAIHNLPREIKEAYVFYEDKEMENIVKSKDFEARKVMYQYLKLMANI